MAAKLALIDSDLLMRLLNKSNPLPPADPTLKEINRIDDKMQTVLTERETDKNVQLKKYNELLTRYNTHINNYQNHPSMKITNTSPSTTPITTPKNDDDKWSLNIIESLPKTYRKQGDYY